ncbi:hypothetical protein E3N88_43562 [Mikania micrantha]|uniref:Uncharacterized protein n=1 Tax=Mikania micrantha TaxID=192012 RepID=A0A5N6LGR7_9ASTR|nr:hypothetical protein E3N88_43562 [Mikania micrantha]
MVFKGRFFHSKKSSDISSPEGSNSPRSTGSSSNSPIKSDKKKAKSTGKDERHPTIGSSFRQIQVKDASNSASISKDHSRSKDGVQNIKITGKPSLGAGTSAGSSNLTRKGAAEVPATVSPILASSLGLNRIKTRSGPLPQETFFKFDGNSNKSKASSKMSSLGASNLSKSKTADGGDFKEGFGTETNKVSCKLAGDDGSSPDSMSTESLQSRDYTPNVLGRSRLRKMGSLPPKLLEIASLFPVKPGQAFERKEVLIKLQRRRLNLRGYSGGLRSSEVCTPEMKTSYDCENPKESESPRFQAILRVTNAPRKRYPADIKSFSHELNSKRCTALSILEASWLK